MKLNVNSRSINENTTEAPYIIIIALLKAKTYFNS